MRLEDGRLTPIENLKPGDRVASIQVPGLEVDVPYRAQYNWLSHHGLHGATPIAARVASIRLGEHHGFMVINRRLKATPEHPFMIRRGDEWGFASAEFIQPGDFLIDEHMNEEEVKSVVRIDAPTRTVAIHIPGTNTLLAEGVWVHNDMPATAQSSGSGSASSASGSGSGSGPGSGSGSMSGSSSGSSSGSKSSGSSSFSTSGSMSGSSYSSGSGSGSMSGSSSPSGGGSGSVIEQ
ncbi:MAG: Hint domain-containing protein [Vicinamibacterales bacterium]